MSAQVAVVLAEAVLGEVVLVALVGVALVDPAMVVVFLDPCNWHKVVTTTASTMVLMHFDVDA